MNTTRREALAIVAAALAPTLPQLAFAKGKHHHKDGKKLAGGKPDGNHVIEKNGPHTVSLDMKGGKVAGMHVKHEKKGELPVKKYKTNKKMVALDRRPADGIVRVGYMQVQQTYLGTTYIGYSYYDEWGDEQIYWFPYDMILDGDTGAIEYVPA